MNSNSDIMALLEEFNALASSFDACLTDDRLCFSSNNLEGLEKNNAQKHKLQIRMHTLMETLEASPQLAGYTGTLYQKLERYQQTIAPQSNTRFAGHLIQLQEILARQKQSMLINRLVISANLHYLRNLMHTIMQHTDKPDMEACTYGSRGELK